MRRLLLVLAVAAVAGCSFSALPTPRPTYRPVGDATLYARLGAIAGVVEVRLRWTNGLDFPNGYRGTVYARRGAPEGEILDRVLAILRQGRPGADLGGIDIAPAGAFAVSAADFGLLSEADYAARYGPQPGTGIPPPTSLHRVR